MNTAASVRQMLKKYGSAVFISQSGPSVKTKALIHPLFYKNKMYIDGHYLPQGYCDGGHYLYYGMPDVLFTEPFEQITIDCPALKTAYRVKRAEVHLFQDKPVYVWAVITPCTKAEAFDEGV